MTTNVNKTTTTTTTKTSIKHWKRCEFCTTTNEFESPFQFGNHLRTYHSKIEGGSYVCSYGPNSMCPLLPYEGVSGRDYESHIAKCHIFPIDRKFNDNEQKLSTQQQQQQSSTTNEQIINDEINRNCQFPSPSSLIVKNSNTTNIIKEDKPNIIDNVNWNIFSASQDLISVLNDPNKSRSYYDNLFTKDWGNNFIDNGSNYIAPYIIGKKPSQLLFDNYMKKIKKRNNYYVVNDAINTINNEDDDDDDCNELLIPKLFFNQNFNLNESDTFIKLLQLIFINDDDNNNNDDNDDNTSLKSLEILFQKKSMNSIQKLLSEYLDQIEQQLSKQIDKRSKDFFQVMSSMDVIMERLKDSIRQVTICRQNCNELSETLAKPMQRIIERNEIRKKYNDIYRKINWIATVHQTQPTIQLLLSKNDYAGALDLISTSEEVVEQELNGVISLRYLRLQLMEIEKVIEQMLNEEFYKYLTAEWNRPINDDNNDNNDINDNEENYDWHKEKLLSIIYGMLKLQNFNFIDTFREEAFTAIKTNVKQTVIEILSSEDNIEISGIDINLYEQMNKCLSMDKWLQCLSKIFDHLLILLKRIRYVYNVINNGFTTINNNSNNNSNSNTNDNSTIIIQKIDYYEMISRLKEILHSICDFANSRVANIIELRSNNNDNNSSSFIDRFDINQFLKLLTIIELFIDKCEEICEGRRSPQLKLIIQIQSNRFITKFHDERKRKLRQLLDLEQWKPVNNITIQIQRLFYKIIVDIDQLDNNMLDIYNDFKIGKFDDDNDSSNSNNSNSYIRLNNDERFIIINTVINLTYMIIDYCQLAQQFSKTTTTPSTSTATTTTTLSLDIFMRLIDLLKLFNSRTSQLILGAEALQISGLKTISARTLIISMRSLIFVLRFIPRIRKHFQQQQQQQLEITTTTNIKSPTTLINKYLDELMELYMNHIEKIPEKIINLVQDVIHVHIINKWMAKAPIPSTSFQIISQHLLRLHDNIQDLLPNDDLLKLFQNIHQILIKIFREQLIRLKINNNGGPQHGLVIQELAFYTQNMKNLSIGKDLDLNYNNLWTS